MCLTAILFSAFRERKCSKSNNFSIYVHPIMFYKCFKLLDDRKVIYFHHISVSSLGWRDIILTYSILCWRNEGTGDTSSFSIEEVVSCARCFSWRNFQADVFFFHILNYFGANLLTRITYPNHKYIYISGEKKMRS